MNKKNINQDHLNVLRKIQKQPNQSQRNLAQELNFSLGKLNYCLKELKKKDTLRLKIFKKILKKLIIFIF